MTTGSKGSGLRAIALDVIVPAASYYALRAAGASVYVSLLVGAVLPAARTLPALLGRRKMDRLGAFMLGAILLGVAVSLIGGSPRFLLAKGAVVSAAVGVWFLVSASGPRPLSFLFARSLLEGRRFFTDEPWDVLWARSPSFRRGWRISSVIWGVGMLVDAAARVVMAYSLPVDVVPALDSVLIPVTIIVVMLIDQINQQVSGLRRIMLARQPDSRSGQQRGRSAPLADVPSGPHC